MAGSSPKLLGISGSLRRDSFSTAVLTTLLDAVAEEAQAERFDIGTLPLYNADLDGKTPPEPVAELKAAIAEADALLFVTPEYNYGMPGVLKNAIDWASRPAYRSVLREKPAAIVSVSGSFVGGARAQMQLRAALMATLARVFPWPDVLIGNAGSKITDGRLTDETSLRLSLEPVRALLAEVAASSPDGAPA